MKRNNLLLFICFIFAFFPRGIFAQSEYQDPNEDSVYNITEESTTDYAQPYSSNGGAPLTAKENPDYQELYQSKEPEGVKLDEKAVKKMTDDLNFAEKEKKEEPEEKKRENKPFEIKRKAETGSIWLGQGGKTVAYTIAIIALIALVAFLIMRIGKKEVKLQVEKSSVHGTGIVDEKKLATLPIDDLMSQAVEDADYKMAVRLLYLNSLKLLMEKGFVRPSPEKTNFDYVRELTGNIYQQDFRSTTGLFEKIWYGESELDRNIFNQIKLRFVDFQDRLRYGK